MHDSRSNAGPTTALAIVLLLLLVGSGAIYFLWHRQQALSALQDAKRQANEAKLAAMAKQHPAARQKLDEIELQDWKKVDAIIAELVESGAKPEKMIPFSGSVKFGSETKAKIESDILSLLLAQQQAWNEGDIDVFMEYYWKDENLTFSSGGKVTHGWQATLEGYKSRYPSKREMGELTFSNIEIPQLGTEYALVLGNWKLTRELEDLGGNFSLVFHQFNGQWLIVHDHTSKSEPATETAD